MHSPFAVLLSFGSGFRVQGSGFKVQGSGFRVQGSRFKVQGSRFRVQGSGFRGSGFRGSRFRVQGSRFRVQGSGFKVQGSGFRGSRFRGSRFSWRLRRLFLEDGILVSQSSPLGKGAPSSTSHFSHSSAAAEAACVGVMTPCSAMRARTTVMRFAPSFGCEMGS